MVLIAAAIVDGLVFSGREAGKTRLRAAWWLDFHRGLGGYALIFTGLHIVTAFGADIGVGLAQIFLPNASSSQTTAFTFGVLAMYGMLVVVLTTWPRQLSSRKLWHAVHLLAIPVAILTGVHAYLLGTDARAQWYMALTLVLVAVVMYPVGLRLTGIYRRRDERNRAPRREQSSGEESGGRAAGDDQPDARDPAGTLIGRGGQR